MPSLEILIGEAGIDGDDIRKGAHGDAVFIGELLAIELLGGGAVAEGLEAEDPEIVGAEGFDELIDIGVEPVDGRGDQDDGGDADGDAEDGEAGAQLVFAQSFEGHVDGFVRVCWKRMLVLRAVVSSQFTDDSELV